MRSVYRGIDSLEIRVGVKGAIQPSQSAIALFEQADRVRQTPYGVEVDDIAHIRKFSLCPFQILRHGDRPYRYILNNPDIAEIKVWNLEGWDNGQAQDTGQLFISFRSKYLLENGWEAALRNAQNLAAHWFSVQTNRIWMKISRLDICTDIERDEPITLSEFEKFQTRSRLKQLYPSKPEAQPSHRHAADPPQSGNKGGAKPDDYLAVCPDELVGRHLTTPDTVYFGRFGSPIYARIYNKRLEARKPDKQHWESIWEGNGARPDSYIFRTEYSLSGQYLRELLPDANEDWLDPSFALTQLDRIWSYLSRQWLVQTERAANGKREAAILTEYWEAVADSFGAAPPPRRHRLPRPNLRELLAQIKGCILTYTAMLGRSGEYGSALDLYDTLGDWFMSNCFQQEYDARRNRLGLIDTNFQSNYKASIRKTYMYHQLVTV